MRRIIAQSAAWIKRGRLATFAAAMLMEAMIIAIDGPAASGKGTLGKRLAAHYRFRHLDTGLLYRAVAKAVLDAGGKPEDSAAAIAAARDFEAAWIEDASLKSDRLRQRGLGRLGCSRGPGCTDGLPAQVSPPRHPARCWMAAILEP